MIKCAIVGATGLVGRTFLKVLEEKKLPIDEYVLFASKNSAGSIVEFKGKQYTVQELTHDSYKLGFDYALFSAGASTAREYAKDFSEHGTVVIDNSSCFRQDENVPLVVPEVNIKTAYNSTLIANPNCSTIQAMVALAPLHKAYGIKRIVYSTYQAVSGAGQKGIEDYYNSPSNLPMKKFPYQIYNNCIPHIDSFLENGYTKEEMKMVNETHKILGDNSIKVTATCVRVPVLNCHSESINVEFNGNTHVDLTEIRRLLSKQEGLIVLDEITSNLYPINTMCSDKNEVMVGRIRKDESIQNGINIWVVADNVRKGAATNAVQILEKLIEFKANSHNA